VEPYCIYVTQLRFGQRNICNRSCNNKVLSSFCKKVFM